MSSQGFCPCMSRSARLVDWVPALALMVLIFVASSRPENALPQFGIWDYALKKLGHVVGYGFLGAAYFHASRAAQARSREPGAGQVVTSPEAPPGVRMSVALAWFLALVYASTDELHQRFVPGRHGSLLDILVFDGLGAALGALALWAVRHARERLR